jgi:hypothetical protein
VFIDTFAALAKRQQALDPAAAKVLYDNLWTLYDDSDTEGCNPAALSPEPPEVQRLDAAVTLLEALQRQGCYMHDVAGHCLTRDQYISAVKRALDVVAEPRQ